MSFTDKQFPAQQASIGTLMKGRVVWQRPNKIFGSRYSLFDGIGPDDIQQGTLGDCWLLSAFSVLAEHPDRVKKLFKNTRVDRNGRYAMKIYLDGVETYCTVDDCFPVLKGTRTPAFSRNKHNELWVLIAEKVYAKLHGSYEAIEAGAPGDALADLTGAPYKTYDIGSLTGDKKASFWKKLVRFDQEHFVLCASVPHKEGVDWEKELGLVEAHAYGLLSVHDLGADSPDGFGLVKLRNPWGKTEWKGDFGDDSDKWTDELKKKVGFRNADDGIFFMTFDDFVAHFYNLTVLRYHEDWVHTSATKEADSDKFTFFLEVTEETMVLLTLHQRRGGAKMHTRFAVLAADTHEPMGGSEETFCATEALSSREMTLPAGKYIVLAEVYPNDVGALPKKFNLSAYSNNTVTLGESSEDAHGLNFVLPEHAKKFGRCSACKKVLSGATVTAIGRKFHPECFACCKCREALTGSFLVIENEPMCGACHASMAAKCGGCNKPCTGPTLKALDRSWHPECFKCNRCSSALNGPFYVVSNHPVCDACI